jgi:hypothetical protein
MPTTGKDFFSGLAASGVKGDAALFLVSSLGFFMTPPWTLRLFNFLSAQVSPLMSRDYPAALGALIPTRFRGPLGLRKTQKTILLSKPFLLVER